MLLYFRKKKKSPFLQGSQASGNVQTKVARSNGAIMLTGINASTRRKKEKCYSVHHKSYTAAFLKLWSADHKWSSGSTLVVFLD